MTELTQENASGGEPLQEPTLDLEAAIDAAAAASGEGANSTAEAGAEDSGPRVPPLPPSQTVTQEFPIFLPLEEPWNNSAETLALPAENEERTEQILQAQPNVDVSKTQEGREWAFYVEQADRIQPMNDYFHATAERDQAAWRQVVRSEKGALGAAAPVFKEQTDGKLLVGDAAVLRVRALMGMGSVVQIPLWHSGFWVTIKAPGDSALLELYRRITEEKINLGRQTYGLALANNSVFFAGWVMDFVLAHVYDSSLVNKSMDNVRARISSLDVSLLAWGIACAIWPRGFQYARSVLDQSQEPTKVIKERLSVGKLLWVDTSSLTPWQITHMAQRFGNTMTDAAVERYRSEFTRGRGREVAINEKIKLTLRVPSLDQYLTNGQRWVNNIVAMVDRAFGMTQDERLRDEYIMDQGKATNFRQYGHWVERMDAGGQSILNEETLDETFDALSSDDQARRKFFTEVRKFMEDSTVAMIAVPTYEPQEQPLTMPKFPHLLPLDVLSTFFTMLVQRARLIQSRG